MRPYSQTPLRHLGYTSMSISQLISEKKKKKKNVLDLVITEVSEKINIVTTSPGPFISDHRMVITTLNVKKECPQNRSKEN